MIKRYRGSEIRDNCKFQLVLPGGMGFDYIICLFLRAHCRSDQVSALLARQCLIASGVAQIAHIYQNGEDMRGHKPIGACKEDVWAFSIIRHCQEARATNPEIVFSNLWVIVSVLIGISCS